jgi:hypothetical protein
MVNRLDAAPQTQQALAEGRGRGKQIVRMIGLRAHQHPRRTDRASRPRRQARRERATRTDASVMANATVVVVELDEACGVVRATGTPFAGQASKFRASHRLPTVVRTSMRARSRVTRFASGQGRERPARARERAQPPRSAVETLDEIDRRGAGSRRRPHTRTPSVACGGPTDARRMGPDGGRPVRLRARRPRRAARVRRRARSLG